MNCNIFIIYILEFLNNNFQIILLQKKDNILNKDIQILNINKVNKWNKSKDLIEINMTVAIKKINKNKIFHLNQFKNLLFKLKLILLH